MATDEVMKNYFARFIGHEMMFMVFSSDFHGIFTNLSFIVEGGIGSPIWGEYGACPHITAAHIQGV